AARLGPDFSVGGPGSEPLGKNDLAVRLAEQSEAGRPGRIHSDAKTHRKAVNDALYKLSDRRFDAVRTTLLPLRRPKLSDKLAEIGRRRKGIETRNAEISGRVGALTQLEAYRKGQDVAPLRELVAGLENAARTARENARRLRGIATSEAESSGRATSGAIEARELA